MPEERSYKAYPREDSRLDIYEFTAQVVKDGTPSKRRYCMLTRKVGVWDESKWDAFVENLRKAKEK